MKQHIYRPEVLFYSLQRKRKWSVVSVSRPHLHIGSTVSLKSCLNLCSLKWLKINLGRNSSLKPLVNILQKTEFSLGLTKLNIIIPKENSVFCNISIHFLCFIFAKKQKFLLLILIFIYIIYIYIIYILYIYIYIYIYYIFSSIYETRWNNCRKILNIFQGPWDESRRIIK